MNLAALISVLGSYAAARVAAEGASGPNAAVASGFDMSPYAAPAGGVMLPYGFILSGLVIVLATVAAGSRLTEAAPDAWTFGCGLLDSGEVERALGSDEFKS